MGIVLRKVLVALKVVLAVSADIAALIMFFAWILL